MKKLIAIAFVLCAGLMLADSMPPSPAGPSLERRQRKRKRVTPEMQMRKFGGFVTAAYDGRYCYFMNAQKRVQDEAVEWAAAQIRQVSFRSSIFRDGRRSWSRRKTDGCR